MEVDAKEGIDWRNISEDLHGEEVKWVSVGEKVNEFPCRRAAQGHLLWQPVGRMDLAPKKKSWARGTDLGGVEAQMTDGAISEEGVIYLFIP